MTKIAVLVVNINRLKYTKNCIKDLMSQLDDHGNPYNFDLYIVDQGSTEPGTSEYFEKELRTYWDSFDGNLEIFYNGENVDLNRVWNRFYEITDHEYLCYLNNDVRIPYNFLNHTVQIFEREPEIKIVNHATNHPRWQVVKKQLTYDVVKTYQRIKQGWDFTIRRESYTWIPDELKLYCGDDFIFEHVLRSGGKTAFCTSAPMIHYQGTSKSERKDNKCEVSEYIKLGYPHHLRSDNDYARIHPHWQDFIYE